MCSCCCHIDYKDEEEEVKAGSHVEWSGALDRPLRSQAMEMTLIGLRDRSHDLEYGYTLQCRNESHQVLYGQPWTS